MELQQIREEISVIIGDSSFTPTKIDGYIRDCIDYLNTVVQLPGRKSIGSVQTEVGQPHVALSTLDGGFNCRILKAICSSGPLDIYPNLDELFDEYASRDNVSLTGAGTLKGVAVEGNTLWYQKVPESATAITVMYYKDLPYLTKESSVLSDIPLGLHRPLLIHGTSWIIFDKIEEDVTEKKVNATSNFYLSFDESNRHSGITKLRTWIGRTRRHHISSTWSV